MNIDSVKNEYFDYIKNSMPCVAAKTALLRNSLNIFVASDLSSEKENQTILNFIYDFVDRYRNSKEMFSSVAIIFADSKIADEKTFEKLMWQKLQQLNELDSQNYSYDKRVSNDVDSEKFSFSLKEEAFFVVGLHPHSSRLARQFKYPTLVFNPHQQFEILREKNCFEKIKNATRKNDIKMSGSINPMLEDYGHSSETRQYSGMKYDNDWKCPLKIKHKTYARN